MNNPAEQDIDTITVEINQIKIVDRVRKDFGDVEELAESIREDGLLQPIVITRLADDPDYPYQLISGHRRLMAFDQLERTSIPAVFKENISESKLKKWELIENIFRKDMDWKEKCLGIAEVHEAQRRESVKVGDSWTVRLTGSLLNLTGARVSNCLAVAARLKEDDKDIWGCNNMLEALQKLSERKVYEARKLAAQASAKRVAQKVDEGDWEEAEDFETEEFIAQDENTELPQLFAEDGEKERRVIELSNQLIHADSIDYLSDLSDGSFGAIISDPPYAIDMENLDQQGELGSNSIDWIAETHNKEDNLQLLRWFIPEAYRLLHEHAYMILWCDFEHYQKLYDYAKNAGFTVQHWPLIWHKSSPCKNGAPYVNFTKNYEIALVARKGQAKLQMPQNSSVWSGQVRSSDRVEGHPFVKPYGLWEWLTLATCPPGCRILDPFAGVGTSVKAFAQLGYDYVAIEKLEPVYNSLLMSMKIFYKNVFSEYDVRFK